MMEKPYEIGRSPDESYLYARAFRDPYTAELALRLAGELVELGEKPGVVGCLIDIRGTTSESSIVEKYEFAHNNAQGIGLPHHWKIAFLVDHSDGSLGFVETVMTNAGYRFLIFEDESEAITWLKVGPSS
jgi:hypothetical protein